MEYNIQEDILKTQLNELQTKIDCMSSNIVCIAGNYFNLSKIWHMSTLIIKDTGLSLGPHGTARIRKAIGYINSEEFSCTLDIQDCEAQTEEYQQQTAALEQFIYEYSQALQIFKTGMYKKES